MSVLPHFASDVINRFLQSFDIFLPVVHSAMNSQIRKEKGFCGNLRAQFPLIKKEYPGYFSQTSSYGYAYPSLFKYNPS